MDQNLESKLELKSRIINFYNSNKIKIYIFITTIVLTVIFLYL